MTQDIRLPPTDGVIGNPRPPEGSNWLMDADPRTSEQNPSWPLPPRPGGDLPEPGVVPSACSPFYDSGTSYVFSRIKASDVMKAWDKASKSPIIDSFRVPNGLSRGAHRATDHCHDPLLGFFRTARQAGFKQACKVWPKHVASDAVTPMSLPLPGSSLAGDQSVWVRTYASKSLNFRTGVVSPLVGVTVTELETRWRHRHEGHDELARALIQAHRTALVISSLSAAALGVFGGPAAVIVAFAVAAFWSGVAAGIHWMRTHRAEIEEAVRTAKAAIGKGVEATRTPINDALAGDRSTDQQSVESEPAESKSPHGLAVATPTLRVSWSFDDSTAPD